MTRKADFNAEEWSQILEAPPIAGMIVIAAERGGTLRETLQMSARLPRRPPGRHGAGGARAARGDRRVAAELDPKEFGSQEELNEKGLGQISDAISTLEAKATSDEVDAFRGFVLAVAERVAHAHKSGGILGFGGHEVSEKEQEALDRDRGGDGNRRVGRAMRRAASPALAAAVLAVALGAVRVRRGGARGRRSAEGEAPLDGPSCGPVQGRPEIDTAFRCGVDRGPEVQGGPGEGQSFEIGFAVRPRDDRAAPSRGAIFAVEGGPGYASTGTANAFTKLFGGLLERRELVLVDMRGHRPLGPGRSAPTSSRGPRRPWIALSECARRLGDDWEAYKPAPPPRTSTRSARRSGWGRSPSTATPTGPTSPRPTPSATPTSSTRWSSTAPTRSRARTPGTRA